MPGMGALPSFSSGIYVGTPDGIVDLFSAKPKTYYASLIHDALYQFRHEYKEQVSRKTTDLIFLDELQLNKFALSLLYYRIVRWFGWIYWNDLMRRLPQLKYIFLLFTLLLLWLLFSLLNLGIHAVFQFFTAWF